MVAPLWQVPTLKQLAASVLHQEGASAESIGQAGYPEVIGALVAEARAASPRRIERHKRQRAAAQLRMASDKRHQLEPWTTATLSAPGPRDERKNARLEAQRAPAPRRLVPRGRRLRVIRSRS